MASKGARATAGKVSKKGVAPKAKAAPKVEAKPAPKPAAPKASAKSKGVLAKAAATAPKIVAKPKTKPAKKAPAPPAPKPAPKVAKAPKSAPVRASAPKAEKKAPANAVAAKKAAAPKAEAPKAAPKKAPKAAKSKTASAPGADETSGLDVGDSVPDVELVDQDGNAFSLGSLRGQSYVLYFYPKDDTPGCTREACGFRDDIGKFEGANVRVVGVSPDKPESHVRFRDKYGLPFTLLSDVEKTAANAFGVWVKKQNYGREYMGIQRSTFLVDESGKVKKIWRNVKVDGHSQAVLDAAS
ncbi:MAG TPA: thioredoxin-dependent thiol peroxidase [Polyangiaceae bacterium]|nr:thioredoxin-dependent thiol peroxidase [Polyangiaceae bacterium]